ncbi:hypothetical protein BZL35_00653 [Candidatus Pandoraea novymonadis]|uniref:Uncharacterized protein n=1 Tax=Candidatus Pandoraea novymonadis TaxID=1808959 RepID=A0ABX5FFG6_9BURK|nr:hypothetical protein BZL35_00653 [Candidatus Pandoraea novymonadis]
MTFFINDFISVNSLSIKAKKKQKLIKIFLFLSGWAVTNH